MEVAARLRVQMAQKALRSIGVALPKTLGTCFQRFEGTIPRIIPCLSLVWRDLQPCSDFRHFERFDSKLDGNRMAFTQKRTFPKDRPERDCGNNRTLVSNATKPLTGLAGLMERVRL